MKEILINVLLGAGVLVAVMLFLYLAVKFKMNLQPVTKVLEAVESFLPEGSIWDTIADITIDLVKTADRMPNWDAEAKFLTKAELNKRKYKWVHDQAYLILDHEGIEVKGSTQQLINTAIEMAVQCYTPHTTK